MKKVVSPVLCSVLMVSLLSGLAHAGSIDKDNFKFNLYNQTTKTNLRYSFQLLDLNQIQNNKVSFNTLSITDKQALVKLDVWQEQFHNLRRDLKNQSEDDSDETSNKNKVGIKFEIDKMMIDVSSKDLKNLERALEAVDKEPDTNIRLRKKVEIVSSFNERFKPPGEITFDVTTIIFKIISAFTSYNVPVTDDSSTAVENSSFWQSRTSEHVDMAKGPGKFDVSKLNTEVCEYNGPKKGFGVHAGLKIKCDGVKLKVKFGRESYSSSLNSRLYYRLGYNVPAIHFFNNLKMKYDRKLFVEFNSRKPVVVPLSIAGFHLKTFAKPKNFDALSFITGFEMKDGSFVSSKENSLNKLLMKSCEAIPCKYTDDNFNDDFESKIANIVFDRGAVVEEIGEEIGPWQYSTLDHASRSEINALLLVGAWTGNFDLRKDNNKLVWVPETGELKHFISDPGSGLGDSSTAFNTGKAITDMRWAVTSELKEPFGLDMQKAVKLEFQSIVKHPAFQKLSFQEAQWMVRRIAGISEDEIAEAVINSVSSAAEYLLLKEKLVSIQQDYIQAFGLQNEFKSRLRVINKQLNFDKDSLTVKLSNGRVYNLEGRGVKLVNGELVY